MTNPPGGQAAKWRRSLLRNFQLPKRQGIDIVEFDASHAESAAAILPQTSPFGLSFADRACVSLGLRTGFKIYSAERRMAEVKLDIPVKLIRKPH